MQQGQLFPDIPVMMTHLIHVVDTFDYTDYQVVVHQGESLEEEVRDHSGHMQRVRRVETFDPPVPCRVWYHEHNMDLDDGGLR